MPASVHRSAHSWIRTDINCRLQALGPPRPGVVGSLVVSRLVNSFLFGVSATDPFVYAAAAVTMMVMALLASALPALRAASADPIETLRISTGKSARLQSTSGLSMIGRNRRFLPRSQKNDGPASLGPYGNVPS
jgi:hypothetical protein